MFIHNAADFGIENAVTEHVGEYTFYTNLSELKVAIIKSKSKSSKPKFNYIFECKNAYEAWIKQKKASFLLELEEKQSRKNLKHSLAIGDVLFSDDHSHIIRFFQVVKIKSEKCVMVRQINQVEIETSESGGYCSPLVDSFKSAEFKVTVVGDNNFMKYTKYLYMRKLSTEISANKLLIARNLNTRFDPVPYQNNG